MTDAERVLAVLIHDVRTPLGVAHGYLRLVRTDKLPSPEDRDRALAGTQDALAKISRLCQDAGGFLEDPRPGAVRAPARQLADRVAAVLAERGVAVTDLRTAGRVRECWNEHRSRCGGHRHACCRCAPGERRAWSPGSTARRQRFASRADRLTVRPGRRRTPTNDPSIRGTRRKDSAWRWRIASSPRWADRYGRPGMA